MFTKFINIAYAMNFIVGSAFSFVFTAGVFIGASWLLYSFCGIGKWIFIPGIVIGVLSGVVSMFRYIIIMSKNIPMIKEKKKTQKQQDPYNE